MNITDLRAEQRRLRVAMVDETGQDEPVLKPEQLAMGIRERLGWAIVQTYGRGRIVDDLTRSSNCMSESS